MLLFHTRKGIGSLTVKFCTSAGDCYGKENAQVEIYAGCGWDEARRELRFERIQ